MLKSVQDEEEGVECPGFFPALRYVRVVSADIPWWQFNRIKTYLATFGSHIILLH